MTIEVKIIVGVVLFSIILVVGAVILLGSTSPKANLEKTVGAKLEAQETFYDFKDIPISGGIVKHSFLVKNIGSEELRFANFVTSCMCTKVMMKTPSSESGQYGMKGMSAPSNWTGVLKPNEQGEIIAIFDPAFHGPQGTGLNERTVSFETNDVSNPYVEFNFKAMVTK